jgi:hypothetical protein
MVVVQIIGALSAGVSAACWIKAASIETPLPMAWLSGPPREVVDRSRSQSWWNAMAAWAAAVVAICQAITLWPIC